MDSYKIKSDNVKDLNVRRLKKARISKSCEFESESDKETTDCGLLPSPSSPIISASSMKMNSHPVESSNVEDLEPTSLKESKCSAGDFKSDIVLLDGGKKQSEDIVFLDSGEKQPEQHEQLKVDQTYDYLPQDYTMTDQDICAQITIEASLPDDVLVKIDDIFVKQEQLLCLLDSKIVLDDDVISAYISCMKDQVHLHSRNNFKVYFENPFISGLLKRDGMLGVDNNGKFITEIVRNYLSYEMALIPINIKDSHWYLAIANAHKCEIQVLDSLCWEFNRADLTSTLQGIQNHLNILQRQQDLNTHNWKDLHVATWMIMEHLQETIQKDGTSCGLFMLKFMEYWNGDALAHDITQENIDNFRYKLAGILLCWKKNTAGEIPKFDPKSATGERSNGVADLKNLNDQKEFKALDSLPEETKYQSLMSVLSKISVQELVGGLCSYIKSINCAETLEKVWIGNSNPYSISMTVRKLQEILKEDCPMDHDCFNLIVRKLTSDYTQEMTRSKGTKSKHYIDLRFWMITDFGRHPNFRKKLSVEQLAESIGNCPGINYSVSRCKSILIPITQDKSGFVLVILNKDTRTVYILDPTPLDPIYRYNPMARYTKKLLWLAEHLPKAMAKTCPGSRWNEDIFLWRQIILTDIPIYNRELSGYLVSLFMCGWRDEHLQLPVLKDGCEIRKQILAHILTYKDNEYGDNMPAGVQDFIRCINAES